jgi:hypothetical protein
MKFVYNIYIYGCIYNYKKKIISKVHLQVENKKR